MSEENKQEQEVTEVVDVSWERCILVLVFTLICGQIGGCVYHEMKEDSVHEIERLNSDVARLEMESKSYRISNEHIERMYHQCAARVYE